MTGQNCPKLIKIIWLITLFVIHYIKLLTFFSFILSIIMWMWHCIVVSTNGCYEGGKESNLAWINPFLRKLHLSSFRPQVIILFMCKNICKMCIVKWFVVNILWFSVIALIHNELPLLLIHAIEIKLMIILKCYYTLWVWSSAPSTPPTCVHL